MINRIVGYRAELVGIYLSVRKHRVVATDVHNLAYKAAKLYFAELGKQSGVKIKIKKNIPMAAGMAGGSADGAATLVGLNELFENAISYDRLLALGAMLGADVPFCVKKGTVYTTGIGEVMVSAPPMPDCAFVIAMPKGKGISTAAAYRLIDALPADTECVKFDDFKKALSVCDLEKIGALLYNKFEVVTPEETGCSALREMLLATGAIGARMSGSGTAVFAIYPHIGAARKAKEMLPESVEAFVCTPARRDYPYIEA